MMLLSFQTWDEACASYEATGAEARRFAAIAGHPGAVKVIRAVVNFYHQGVDDESAQERVKGEPADRSELARDYFQLEFPAEL